MRSPELAKVQSEGLGRLMSIAYGDGVQPLEPAMRLLAVTVSAVALAFATAASAQPSASQTEGDARCLMAMVALSNSNDPTAQRVGQDGIVFFTGRIAAGDPNYDFTHLKAMAATMNAQSAQTDLQQRCGPMLQKYMRQLEAALAPPAGTSPPSTPPASPPKH
jgi:hypothetical protein